MAKLISEYQYIIDNTKCLKLLIKYNDRSINIEESVKVISFLQSEYKIRHLSVTYDSRCKFGHAYKIISSKHKQRKFKIVLPRVSLDFYKKNNRLEYKDGVVSGLRVLLPLHEFVHIIVMVKDKDEKEHHGPKFMKRYDEVLKLYDKKYEKRKKF